MNMDEKPQELPEKAKIALQEGRVIEAIKIVREEYGLGLLQAKTLVEQHMGKSVVVSRDKGRLNRFLPWLIGVMALGPLTEAWHVYSAASMAGHCNTRRGSLVCDLWPKVGTALFGSEHAYLGYVLLVGALGVILLVGAVLLSKKLNKDQVEVAPPNPFLK